MTDWASWHEAYDDPSAHAPHELGGAASESPVGWRVLARKP